MSLVDAGACWKKQGNKGTYLSATIDLEKAGLGEGKFYFLIFHNDKGDNPKRPDYKIAIQVDDGEEFSALREKVGLNQAKQVNGSFNDDEIPF
jgi:hypothetical protein